MAGWLSWQLDLGDDRVRRTTLWAQIHSTNLIYRQGTFATTDNMCSYGLLLFQHSNIPTTAFWPCLLLLLWTVVEPHARVSGLGGGAACSACRVQVS